MWYDVGGYLFEVGVVLDRRADCEVEASGGCLLDIERLLDVVRLYHFTLDSAIRGGW